MKPFAFYTQGIAAGALPSTKDTRDVKDTTLSGVLPLSVNYDTHIDMIEVEHQKKIGICTSYLKSYVEYLYYLKTGKYTRLSAAFLYIVTKRYIDQNKYEGSSPRSALKALMKYGVCRESVFPTNTDLTHEQFVTQDIPKEAFNDALSYRIGGYISIPTEQSLMAYALDKYKLLYTRFELGEEWYTDINGKITWDKNLILPLRGPKTVISGHAVLLSGYEIKDGTFKWKGRNSWSDAWADRGNFYGFSPYQPTECWAITLESVEPLKPTISPTVNDGVLRAFLKVLRSIGVIK
jgi:hypothetical protein